MFEEESGTPPGVELSTITDRMQIRQAVQAGDVESAIDKVNDLNPEVDPLPVGDHVAPGACCTLLLPKSRMHGCAVRLTEITAAVSLACRPQHTAHQPCRHLLTPTPNI
jgi:hypothetical protein